MAVHLFLASDGVTPCTFWKALVKESGELYPYLTATSITFTMTIRKFKCCQAQSSAANVF